MELRQVVYVEAVARLGGFTRAAEALHVAQPAVSSQVRKIEAELGVTLFERTTRRIGLTPEGEVFVGRARRILAELDDLRVDLASLEAVLRGRVVIGATEVLGSLDLPALLAGFHGRLPGVDLALRSGLIAGLLGLLDAGEIDVVLGPVHADMPDRFTARTLVDEQLVLVGPPGHPLSGRTGLDLADVSAEPWVCLPAGSGLRAILDDAADRSGVAVHIPFEASNPSELRSLVSAGLGVALLARSAVGRPGPPVAVWELRSPPAHPPIGLIHHRDRRLGPATRAWQAHVQEAVLRPAAPQPPAPQAVGRTTR